MKRSGLFVVLMLFAFLGTFAQFRNNTNPGYRPQQKSGSDGVMDKFYFGGGGGFGFGSGFNYYNLYPIAGYRVTDDFSVGTGFQYQRFNYTYLGSTSYTQYGFTPFARYNINPLFVQTEFDLISAPTVDPNINELVRSIHNRFLVGLGYSSGRKNNGTGFNLLVMYDLLYTTTEAGIFGSPVVFRAFFLF